MKTYENRRFTGPKSMKVNLNEVTFKNCTFSDVTFEDSTIVSSIFECCSFMYCHTDCVKIQDSIFRDCSFMHSSLLRTSLKSLSIEGGKANSLFICAGVLSKDVKNVDTLSVTIGGATYEECDRHRKSVLEGLTFGTVPEKFRNLRDFYAISQMEPNCLCRQENGKMGFFFGDTAILADVVMRQGFKTYTLENATGTQVACGEWYDLQEDDAAVYAHALKILVPRRWIELNIKNANSKSNV